ncbi:hypothetical protein G3496_03635 [Shewanella baltica]|uniref:hypothetical protein n=1 Tax=Shewanella baltica TaxID=62322 RepID=UPI00217DEFC1|nr:hypothetical protein [Shewanella baltica]MCS6134016.1 hypothetical protein [Shewanella baltica]
MEALSEKVETINTHLVRLDGSVQALGAVTELLNLCPAEHKINANALGHLLHVVKKDVDAHLLAIDVTQHRLCENLQSQAQQG